MCFPSLESLLAEVGAAQTRSEVYLVQLKLAADLGRVLGSALGTKVPSVSPMQFFLLNSLAKGCVTAKSVLLLLTERHVEDALVLCRGLTELSVRVAWILKVPELREFRLRLFEHTGWKGKRRRFEGLLRVSEFDVRQRRKLLRKVSGIERKALKKAGIAALQAGIERVARKKRTNAVRLWDDFTFAEMCGELGEPFLYEVQYRFGSVAVHSEPSSVVKFSRQDPDGFVFGLDYDEGDATLVADLLSAALWLLGVQVYLQSGMIQSDRMDDYLRLAKEVRTGINRQLLEVPRGE